MASAAIIKALQKVEINKWYRRGPKRRSPAPEDESPVSAAPSVTVSVVVVVVVSVLGGVTKVGFIGLSL